MVQNQDNAEEIDLLELFFALVHNWRVLLLGALVGAFIFGLIHVIVIKPSYQASTELYITSNDSVISLQDLQIGTAIAEDYRFIITSRSVLNQVIESLQLDLDYEQLKKMIEVTNPNGTHIIRHHPIKYLQIYTCTYCLQRFLNMQRSEMSPVSITSEKIHISIIHKSFPDVFPEDSVLLPQPVKVEL